MLDVTIDDRNGSIGRFFGESLEFSGLAPEVLGVTPEFHLQFRDFNHELVAKAIQSPNIMIGLSDAGAHVDQLCNAGMPSYLIQEWVTKRGLLTIEQAVRRLTSEPAAFFGFSNKG